jgi:Second Messenger Oligonucleotide or Dinucleotide Synthetase domain
VNYTDRFLRETASYSVLDVMLADIAVRVQLSPTDYQLAINHYEAISEWIEREDSPLHGRVQLLYPQGGFMIGATIARHSTDAEFDIDVMAQIDWPTNVDPEVALATTHHAIRGEPGSRYYKKAERKTRCSTVNYDGMHLDVTPAVGIVGREEKTSFIFHSKPSDPREPKQALYANPFGFGHWFLANTPADEIFGAYFEKASLDYNKSALQILGKASDPVPVQMQVYRKSRAVICLQLIKRWRNLAYDRRHPRLRIPPSVLLAYYAATIRKPMSERRWALH